MKSCALGLIFTPDRSAVLLIQRRDLPVWVLPGGGIDTGETAEAAVIREVLEETGFSVSIKSKIAEYQPINRFTSASHLFECQIVEGSATPGTESRQVAFFPLHQLPSPLFPYHEEWLRQAQLPSKGMICEAMSLRTFWRILICYAFRPLIGLRYICARLGFPINSKKD